MLQRLDLLQEAALLQVSEDGLAGLEGGHAGILAAVQHMRLVDGVLACSKQSIGSSLIGSAGHVAVVGEDADDGQVMAQADLKVVGVVGRGDLHDTGTLVMSACSSQTMGISLFSRGRMTWQPCR